MKRFDAIALGECLVDILASVSADGEKLSMEGNAGGAPANVMAGMAKLGMHTAFIGKLGNDRFGRFLEDRLNSANIDLSGMIFTDEHPTTLAIVSLDDSGNRSFSFYRNHTADMMLSWDEIDKSIIQSAKIYHFGSVAMTDEPSRTAMIEGAKYAKEHGVPVSFDVNLRPALWHEDARPVIESVFHLVDLLKVSEEELEFLTDAKSIEEGAMMLWEKYDFSMLVVTMGAKGCVCVHGGQLYYSQAYDLECVDTTGAGDTFWAAILSEIVRADKSIDLLSPCEIENMLDYANAAGSLAITGYGAIPSMPDDEKVRRCMAEVNKMK